MSSVFEELREEGRVEGIALGMKKGIAAGREEGIILGMKRGREEGEAAGREKGEAAGREEGIILGMERGEAVGREEGIALGMERGEANILFVLVANGKLTAIEAACMLKISTKVFLEMMAKAGFTPPCN